MMRVSKYGPWGYHHVRLYAHDLWFSLSGALVPGPQTAYCSAIPTVFDVPSVREVSWNRALPLVTLSMVLTPATGSFGVP